MTELVSEPLTERSTVGWAAALLSLEGDDAKTARRLVAGLALSWLFGASTALVTGAWGATLGVPALLGVVGSLGVPSVVIGLVLTRAEVDARDAARAAVHGVATAGLVLGGLAPATFLYVASTTSDLVRLLVTTAALGLAGALGLARMGHALGASVAGRGLASQAAAHALVLAFALFSGVLALRLWATVGPALLGHASASAVVLEGDGS
jgi:hypothetical protein